MVKNFQNLRVAQVGLRPKPFCSVIFNEGELLQKFGIQTEPVNLAVVIDKYNRILGERDEELEEGARLLESRYEIDALSKPLLKKVYAFVLLYEEIIAEYNVDAVSAECWTAMQLAVGAMPCAAYSVLADKGYIIGANRICWELSQWHFCLVRLWDARFHFSGNLPFGIRRKRIWNCYGTVVRLPIR